jgi:hypothetical protein
MAERISKAQLQAAFGYFIKQIGGIEHDPKKTVRPLEGTYYLQTSSTARYTIVRYGKEGRGEHTPFVAFGLPAADLYQRMHFAIEAIVEAKWIATQAEDAANRELVKKAGVRP